jgi:hypothetical protein
VITVGDITVLIWKDKIGVHMYTDVHGSWAEEKCCDAVVKDLQQMCGLCG